MSLGSILLLLALLILVVTYVSHPITHEHSEQVSEQEQHISALLAERERILGALLELDEDQDVGKIPIEIYPKQRASLLQRGAEVLRKLDAIQGEEAGTGKTEDDELEALISKRRQKRIEPTKAAVNDADVVEEQISTRREQRKQPKSKFFCSNCGHSLKPSDRFCSNCGTAVGGG